MLRLATFGLDPARDVQVLAPMHRGPSGAGNLNTLLQDALTPTRDGAPERRYCGRVFRIGDKVTHLRNNYDKGATSIFNGTAATVTSMSLEDQTLTVLTGEDEQVDYDFDELDEGLRRHHPPLPRQRIPGRGHPARHLVLDDAATQPALHRRPPRQETHHPAGSRRALAQAARTPGAGRRHTTLTHRLHPLE